MLHGQDHRAVWTVKHDSDADNHKVAKGQQRLKRTTNSATALDSARCVRRKAPIAKTAASTAHTDKAYA